MSEHGVLNCINTCFSQDKSFLNLIFTCGSEITLVYPELDNTVFNRVKNFCINSKIQGQTLDLSILNKLESLLTPETTVDTRIKDKPSTIFQSFDYLILNEGFYYKDDRNEELTMQQTQLKILYREEEEKYFNQALKIIDRGNGVPSLLLRFDSVDLIFELTPSSCSYKRGKIPTQADIEKFLLNSIKDLVDSNVTYYLILDCVGKEEPIKTGYKSLTLLDIHKKVGKYENFLYNLNSKLYTYNR